MPDQMNNLLGLNDARSWQGIFSRGKNLYNGGASTTAHQGPGSQKPKPPNPSTIARMLSQNAAFQSAGYPPQNTVKPGLEQKPNLPGSMQIDPLLEYFRLRNKGT